MTEALQTIRFSIDLATGKLSSPATYSTRRVRDLADFFQDQAASAQDERLIYEVYEYAVPHDNGQLLLGTTTLHPGRVGDEYFMTKGHFHFKEDVAEIFICLHGQGFVLLEKKDGEGRALPVKANDIVYSPPFHGHRLINSGAEKFIVAHIGQADAGHDYGPITARGMARLVVERRGNATVIDNPHYAR